jgi:hypothetical protein
MSEFDQDLTQLSLVSPGVGNESVELIDAVGQEATLRHESPLEGANRPSRLRHARTQRPGFSPSAVIPAYRSDALRSSRDALARPTRTLLL